MTYSQFWQRSNSYSGGFSILGSTCSSNHKDPLVGFRAGPTQMCDNHYQSYCRTNSNSAGDPKQTSSQQTIQAEKQSNGHRVRFSCTSECDQLLASKVGQEQKSIRSREDGRVLKKENWHLPQLQQSPDKGSRISYSDTSKVMSKSFHSSGVDKISAQTSQQRSSVSSQAQTFSPKPILKRLFRADSEDNSEEPVSTREVCLPQRQNNWLRTIRLLEQNLERQELLAQEEEMQQQQEAQEPEDKKPQKQQVKPKSHQEQVCKPEWKHEWKPNLQEWKHEWKPNLQEWKHERKPNLQEWKHEWKPNLPEWKPSEQEWKPSQPKLQKQNCRSISAHDVKTVKSLLVHPPLLDFKENIPFRNVRKRERKAAPKKVGCPANILVYDSEIGALSAKLHMNPTNNEKIFRKYSRSLS